MFSDPLRTYKLRIVIAAVSTMATIRRDVKSVVCDDRGLSVSDTLWTVIFAGSDATGKNHTVIAETPKPINIYYYDFARNLWKTTNFVIIKSDTPLYSLLFFI